MFHIVIVGVYVQENVSYCYCCCLRAGECDYNYTEAKTAINRVAEVYIDECRTRGVEITDWRTDYSAG